MPATTPPPELMAAIADHTAATGQRVPIAYVTIGGVNTSPADARALAKLVAGMKVTTHSEKLARLRSNLMELYLSDHPADCPACAMGECEIKELAKKIGVKTKAFRIAVLQAATKFLG